MGQRLTVFITKRGCVARKGWPLNPIKFPEYIGDKRRPLKVQLTE